MDVPVVSIEFWIIVLLDQSIVQQPIHVPIIKNVSSVVLIMASVCVHEDMIFCQTTSAEISTNVLKETFVVRTLGVSIYLDRMNVVVILDSKEKIPTKMAVECYPKIKIVQVTMSVRKRKSVTTPPVNVTIHAILAAHYHSNAAQMPFAPRVITSHHAHVHQVSRVIHTNYALQHINVEYHTIVPVI